MKARSVGWQMTAALTVALALSTLSCGGEDSSHAFDEPTSRGVIQSHAVCAAELDKVTSDYERRVKDLDRRMASAHSDIEALTRKNASLVAELSTLKKSLASVTATRTSTSPPVTTPSSPQDRSGHEGSTPTFSNCVKIFDVGHSTVSTSAAFSTVAWKIVVNNSCSTAFAVDAEYRWFDANDFELASARAYSEHIAPSGVTTLTGQAIIAVDVASRIASAKGRVEPD